MRRDSVIAVIIVISLGLGIPLVTELTLDHFRLIQVRQMLKDHGTPIEMDAR